MIPSPQQEVAVPSYIILECIDPAEYAALIEASKDGVRIILMCGTVDIGKSSKIYSYLTAIFANSPITLAAIEALYV
mgnify:CR=1 FL=1